MTYTTQGLMTRADLDDYEVLTDTGRNPRCPGHDEIPGDWAVYCTRAENCPDEQEG